MDDQDGVSNQELVKLEKSYISVRGDDFTLANKGQQSPPESNPPPPPPDNEQSRQDSSSSGGGNQNNPSPTGK